MKHSVQVKQITKAIPSDGADRWQHQSAAEAMPVLLSVFATA